MSAILIKGVLPFSPIALNSVSLPLITQLPLAEIVKSPTNSLLPTLQLDELPQDLSSISLLLYHSVYTLPSYLT